VRLPNSYLVCLRNLFFFLPLLFVSRAQTRIVGVEVIFAGVGEAVAGEASGVPSKCVFKPGAREEWRSHTRLVGFLVNIFHIRRLRLAVNFSATSGFWNVLASGFEETVSEDSAT
jgi:hypothetical protein